MKKTHSMPSQERFFERVDQDPMIPGSCWIWTGMKNADGYAKYNGHWTAYQLSYVYENGPVPEGLEIDHVCRVKTCVNPSHLEAVTHRENMRRGVVSRGGRNHRSQDF